MLMESHMTSGRTVVIAQLQSTLEQRVRSSRVIWLFRNEVELTKKLMACNKGVLWRASAVIRQARGKTKRCPRRTKRRPKGVGVKPWK